MKSVEKPRRGPLMLSGRRQPPIRAFIDDMTVTANPKIEGKWTLQELAGMISWATMKFKPIGDKMLWEKFDTSRQKNHHINTKAAGIGRLAVEDRPKCLPGRYKAWMYQHGVLPRTLWPFLVYEFSVSKVEEKKSDVGLA
ncbi:Hypothetical predicted protein [Mytilus galloprovincialis]|uniref:Uncharacterized protein n=1 Tax=Mytilus galloprovincialis TaxID=29158 RepID=A0A8B6EUD3_MYTGA|nr:Hypothetical predicted protein [Mytilus galloprovincialis]